MYSWVLLFVYEVLKEGLEMLGGWGYLLAQLLRIASIADGTSLICAHAFPWEPVNFQTGAVSDTCLTSVYTIAVFLAPFLLSGCVAVPGWKGKPLPGGIPLAPV